MKVITGMMILLALFVGLVASQATLTEEQMKTFVSDNNAFAVDLFNQLTKSSDENTFLSPYSISSALGMTYAGANGTTASQFKSTLHFNSDNVHAGFKKINNQLIQSAKPKGIKGPNGDVIRPIRGDSDGSFTINLANSLWGQTGYTFLDSFLKICKNDYGAEVNSVDFKTNGDAAKSTINDWVNKQTNGMIKDLLQSIDPATMLILVNAIYFKADWSMKFKKEDTRPENFTLLGGKQKEVDMMTLKDTFLKTYEGDNFQAIQLPYRQHKVFMTIILPNENAFATFKSSGLTHKNLQDILGKLKNDYIRLSMPKFKFESKFSLSKTLKGLGMQDAFTNSADFSGMDGNRDLFIADVVHDAVVAVDEAGTEAAAATAVVISLTSAVIQPKEPKVVTVDRPFVFLIHDEQGTILFMGQVVEPKA